MRSVFSTCTATLTNGASIGTAVTSTLARPADPACLEESLDPASGRVTRGGSWSKAAWWTRSASRCYDFPALPTNSKGFRVVIGGDLKGLRQESSRAEAEAAEAPP